MRSLLGVKLDSNLTFNGFVTDVVRACNFHIRALRHIRPLLTDEVAATVATSIVQSRLDYCNAILYDTTARNVEKLQRVQNALARVVCPASVAPHFASATELRRKLHWLPVKQRIDYKIGLLTYKARHTGQPAYLASLLKDYVPSRTLRSTTHGLLDTPFFRTHTANKAFSVAAPTVWNSLSVNTKSADTLGTFKSRLKSELFAKAYHV